MTAATLSLSLTPNLALAHNPNQVTAAPNSKPNLPLPLTR